MSDFSTVSESWARAQLAAAGVEHTAIRNVNFDVEHAGGCYGHSEGEYCYCDTSAYIDITIFYLTGRECRHHTVRRDSYDFASLLKELVEWQP
jgi:hypothetical protein